MGRNEGDHPFVGNHRELKSPKSRFSIGMPKDIYSFHIVPKGGTFGYGVCTRFAHDGRGTHRLPRWLRRKTGGSSKWMVYFMEHPKITWMI